MDIREGLNESARFLQDYIAVELAVLYLAKKEEMAVQAVAMWLLQNSSSLDLMVFRIDPLLGSAEYVHDEMSARHLVSASLRKIAKEGLPGKLLTSNEEVVGWQIQELNEKLTQRGFGTNEVLIAACPSTDLKLEELDARERQSLLKLIIGMAAGRYRYDPAAKKSSAVASIMEDIEKLGLVVSDETVRKYLKEAVRVLGQEGKA